MSYFYSCYFYVLLWPGISLTRLRTMQSVSTPPNPIQHQFLSKNKGSSRCHSSSQSTLKRLAVTDFFSENRLVLLYSPSPFLFEWFGFYRSSVKASLQPPLPPPPFPSSVSVLQEGLRLGGRFNAVPGHLYVCCFIFRPFSSPLHNPFPSSLWLHYGSHIQTAGCISSFYQTIVLNPRNARDVNDFRCIITVSNNTRQIPWYADCP